MRVFEKYYVWVMVAYATLPVMAGAIIAPVINLIQADLGISATAAGTIITAQALFIAFCSPVCGTLIDRFGTKALVIIGLVLYGLAGGSGLFLSSYSGLIVSRIFLRLGIAALFNATAVIILNFYTGKERDKIMGWRASANSAGGILWPVVGGFLGRFSWHLPFATYLVALPLAALAWITVPEIRRDMTIECEDESVVQVLRQNPNLFPVYGLAFLTSVLAFGIIVFLPQLLDMIAISNPLQISFFISGMMLAAGLTSLLYGRIRSRFSYNAIVMAALLLWAVSLTMISLVPAVFAYGVSVVLFGIGLGVVLPAVTLLVGEVAPISCRGRIISYLGTFLFLGQFASPIMLGPVTMKLSVSGMFLIAGGFSAVLLAILAVWARGAGRLPPRKTSR